jgi:hypothetical protein
VRNRLEIDQHDAARAAQKEATFNTYKAWIQTKPHLYDCDANEAMFRSYMDFNDVLTSADFDFALSNLEDSLAKQEVPTPAEVIAAENAYRKKLGVPALRELSRIENPLPTRGTLPSEWYGNDISTPEALKQLAKKNLPAFKALVDRFGEEVNEALGVTPRAQVGRSIKMRF